MATGAGEEGSGATITRTRIVMIDGEQAVTIPDALAFEPWDLELDIERVGDELRLRPARRSLAGVLTKFAAFSPEFMADGRGEAAQKEREA